MNLWRAIAGAASALAAAAEELRRRIPESIRCELEDEGLGDVVRVPLIEERAGRPS
jgi:hypothetical protein